MSIAGTVVGRERCHQYAPSSNLAADSPGPLDWHAEADERDLGWVDNAEHSLDAPSAEISDRDRRIGELGAAQRAAARSCDEIAQLGHQLVERKLVRVVNGGRDEATAADRDRRADMDAGTGLKPIAGEKTVKLGRIDQSVPDRLQQQ